MPHYRRLPLLVPLPRSRPPIPTSPTLRVLELFCALATYGAVNTELAAIAELALQNVFLRIFRLP